VIASYSISPAQPAGLSFGTLTGLLSGAPIDVQSAKIYTITATNAASSATRTFTLAVTVIAPEFVLTSTTESQQQNSAIAGYTISSTGGVIASYSISPVAPAGTSFSTSTGLLSGSPTQVQSATPYAVTATNMTGSTARTFILTVTLAAPGVPAQPTGIAGNGQVTVTVAGTGGTPASFAVSAVSDSTKTCTVTGSSGNCVVTGLTNGIAYSFTVTATNAMGTSAVSTASTAVTPATAPSAPTIGVAMATGSTTATVGFTAPVFDGGATITSYTATSSPGGVTGILNQSGSGTIAVSGLTTGTDYTFTVTATNSAGTSVASAASNLATTFAVPDAPTITVIAPSNALLSVAFTAGADGGSALTNYEYSTDGGSTFKSRASSGTVSPIVITTVSSSAAVLVNGTSYDVQIRAVNAIGSGTTTFSTAVTPRTVPGSPTSVSGIAGDAQVSLVWSVPVSDGGSVITDYVVEFNDGGSWTMFADGTSTSASATVTGLTNGTSYTFRVSAINIVGTGTVSTVSTAVTPRTVPGSPTSVSGIAGDAQVSLVWSVPVSDGGSVITDYVVEFNDGDSWTMFADGTSTSASATVTGLTNGQAYAFRVSAINIVGTGTVSTVSTAVTPATTPSAPTITAISPSNGSLSVAFTAGANGGSAITTYKYSTDGGSTFRTRDLRTPASPLVITKASGTESNLVNGTLYNIQIKAVNTIGDGTPTDSTSATPATVPTVPTVGSITSGDASLSVAFTAGANGGSVITNYEYSTNGGSTYKSRATTGTISPLVITTVSNGAESLVNGTNYNVRIRAVNAIGKSVATSSTGAIPRTVPGAPTSVSGTAGNTQVSLTWVAPVTNGGSVITDYVVESSTDGSTYTVFADGHSTKTSATVTGLTNGTSYTFWVSATNIWGSSATSAISGLATPVETVPSAPTGISITSGDVSLSVAFTAGPTGGPAITSYKYSTDGGLTFRTRDSGTTASPLVISLLSSDGTTSLSAETTYDIQIKAVNTIGDGTPTASTSATALTKPSAPTGISITTTSASLSVAFTAGPTGGSAITSYKYSTDNGLRFRTRGWGTTASPLVISLLSSDGTTPPSAGTTYDIQIKAVNTIGDGTPTDSTSAALFGEISCANGGACALGEIGPGGGKVFYVASGTFTSTGSSCGTTCRYLEAAPSDQSTMAWATDVAKCYGAGSSSGTLNCQLNSIYSGAIQSSSRTAAEAIGMGMTNTNSIYERLTTNGLVVTGNYAAGLAYAYSNNLKDDWHLPSKLELNQMYVNKVAIGGFSTGYYWSSSEGAVISAWLQGFNDGSQYSSTKTYNPSYVRPVRAF
jgi:titin